MTADRSSLSLLHCVSGFLAVKLDGVKVGGHQASSTSLATVMTVLYCRILQPHDRVAVKVRERLLCMTMKPLRRSILH